MQVVVRLSLRNAWPHRKDRLRTVQCLHLGFLIDTEHDRILRWRYIQPHNIARFLNEERISRKFERLAALRLESERAPHSRNGRLRNISRVLRCVLLFGRDVSVLAMISSARSSSTFRDGPDRGASVPRIRSSRKRSRHLPTVTNEIPSFSATSVFVRPSAHLRPIFARNAKACAGLRRRTKRSNSDCSTSGSASFRRGQPAMSLRNTTRVGIIQTNLRLSTLAAISDGGSPVFYRPTFRIEDQAPPCLPGRPSRLRLSRGRRRERRCDKNVALMAPERSALLDVEMGNGFNTPRAAP
jgi:hypothetical protein